MAQERNLTETLLDDLQDLIRILEEHTQYDNSDEELSGEAKGIKTCENAILFIKESMKGLPPKVKDKTFFIGLT